MLARVPLDSADPFLHEPFTFPVFRVNMLLAPVAGNDMSDMFEEEVIDVEQDTPVGELVELGAGFALNSAARGAFGKENNEITEGLLLLANSFYCALWVKVKQYRELGHNTSYALARVDLLSAKAARTNTGKDGGWNDYRKLLLILLNRPGGIIDQVTDVMRAHRAIPTERWIDAQHENRRRVDGPPLDEYDVSVPSGGPYTSSIALQNEVAEVVFGPEVVNGNGSVDSLYRSVVQIMIGRVWECLHKKLVRSVKRTKELRASLDQLIDDAKEQLTLANLQAALRKLNEWRKHWKLTFDTEDLEFTSREEELAGLFKLFGAAMELPSKGGYRNPRARHPTLQHSKSSKQKQPYAVLPTESEVAEASEHWADYLQALQDELHSPIPTRPTRNRVELLEGSGDVGMGAYDGKEASDIWVTLGLPGATQFPFAHPGDESKKPVEPMRHQIAGTAAILSRAFTSVRTEGASPTLLCDDVGLGKTYQIIAAFKMIAHWRGLQERSPEKLLPLPPFAVENHTPYFAGLNHIPNQPFLVVVPRTLSSQWLKEIPEFTKRGSFRVVHFSSEQQNIARFFSDPNGDYLKAAGAAGQHAGRVIVIADTSAVAKEATRCFKAPVKLNTRAGQRNVARGDIDILEPRPDVSLRGTIWEQQFMMVAYDESHDLRNSSMVALSAQRLSENSLIRVASTATPIFTSAMDIAAQGRILRQVNLLGSAGGAHYDLILKMKKAREREWEERSSELVAEAIRKEALQAAQEADISDDLARLKEVTAQVERKYNSDDQVKILKSSYINELVIKLLREIMLPHVIHRTGDSKNPDGSSIFNIHPYKYRTVWSPLAEREQEVLDQVNEVHQEHVRRRDRGEKFDMEILKWTNFLLNQKDACFHWEIVAAKEKEANDGLKSDSLACRIPDSWDASNLADKISTRMKKVSELLDYCWQGNPKPPVYREDGTRNLAAEQQQPDPRPLTKPRKFLIYVEYKVHRHMLKRMFAIERREFVEYCGEMTPAKRQEAVDRFTNNPTCRIMLISKVAGAGLNLTAANVVIFVSPVWSGQEKKQIIGRAWRFGQAEEVIVLDIHAPRGPDLALAGYAGSKCAMSAEFLRSERELYEAHQVWLSAQRDAEQQEDKENEEDESSDLEDVPLAGIRQAQRSHVKPRKRKTTDVEVGTDASTSTQPQVQAEGAGQPSLKPVKRLAPTALQTSTTLGSQSGLPGNSSGHPTTRPARSEQAFSYPPRKRLKASTTMEIQARTQISTMENIVPAVSAQAPAMMSIPGRASPAVIPPSRSTLPRSSPALLPSSPVLAASSSSPPSPSPSPSPPVSPPHHPVSLPAASICSSSLVGAIVDQTAPTDVHGFRAKNHIPFAPPNARHKPGVATPSQCHQPVENKSPELSGYPTAPAPGHVTSSPEMSNGEVYTKTKAPRKHIPMVPAHLRPKPKPAPLPRPSGGPGDLSADFFNLSHPGILPPKPTTLATTLVGHGTDGPGTTDDTGTGSPPLPIGAAKNLPTVCSPLQSSDSGQVWVEKVQILTALHKGSSEPVRVSAVLNGPSSKITAHPAKGAGVPPVPAASQQHKRSGFAKRETKKASVKPTGDARDAKASSLNKQDMELEKASAGPSATSRISRPSMF